MKKIAYILATGLILTFASCQTPPDSGDTQTDSTSTQVDSDTVSSPTPVDSVVVVTDSTSSDSGSIQ